MAAASRGFPTVGSPSSSLPSQCFLACHKRCLETLAIQCGHKKLQGRLQLFGRDFSQVASCASDGIPFIITKCITEIDRRALKMKVRWWDCGGGLRSGLRKLLKRHIASPQGIYRVNGVKTRVEKLCQAFENGKELVELSQCSPHDISNVLKLYLRQVTSMFDNKRCPQSRYVSCCHFNISTSSRSPSCLSGCTTA